MLGLQAGECASRGGAQARAARSRPVMDMPCLGLLRYNHVRVQGSNAWDLTQGFRAAVSVSTMVRGLQLAAGRVWLTGGDLLACREDRGRGFGSRGFGSINSCPALSGTWQPVKHLDSRVSPQLRSTVHSYPPACTGVCQLQLCFLVLHVVVVSSVGQL